MKHFISIVAVIGLFVSIAPLSQARLGAHHASTLLMGGLPGTREAAHIHSQLFISAPADRGFQPVMLSGEGNLQFSKTDSELRIRAEHFVPLSGSVNSDEVNHAYQLHLVPRADTVIAVRWNERLEFTIEHLDFILHVADDYGMPLIDIDLPPVRLTTGSVSFDNRTEQGVIDLDAELGLFVGTLTMPATGNPMVDQKLEGEEFLLRYQISLQPLQ